MTRTTGPEKPQRPSFNPELADVAAARAAAKAAPEGPKLQSVNGSAVASLIAQATRAADAAKLDMARSAARAFGLDRRPPKLDDLVGTWKKVSGPGSKTLRIETDGDSVVIHGERGSHRFDNLGRGYRPDASPMTQQPRPGAKVQRKVANLFSPIEGRLREFKERIETAGLAGLYVPTLTRREKSYRRDGSKLIRTEQTVVEKRGLLWFGDFRRGKASERVHSVYERVDGGTKTKAKTPELLDVM